MNWEVTSSAIWCKFANGSTSIKGEAGDISLPLTITEDAWSVEESVVEITLKWVVRRRLLPSTPAQEKRL